MKLLTPWVLPLAVGLACSGPLLGQRSFSDILPADTWAYVGFEGFDACADAAESLNLVEIWKLPAVRKLLQPLIAKASALPTEMPREAEVIGEILRKHLTGSVALAAFKMTVLYGRFGEPIPVPGLALAINLAKDPEGGAKAIAKLVAMGAEQGQDIVIEDGDLDQLPVSRIHFSLDGLKVNLVCGMIDHLFIAALGDEVFRDVLNTSRDPKASTLTASLPLREARAAAHGKLLGEFFFSAQSFKDRLADFVPMEWRRMLQALGLADVSSVYLASSVHAGENEGLIWIGAKAPRRGILGLGGSAQLSEHARRLGSAGSVFTFATKLPAQELALVETAILPYLPAREAKMGARVISQARRLPPPMPSDLLDVIGDEIVVVAELGRISPLPAIVASLGLRDMERARVLTLELLAAAGADVKEVDFEGTKIYQCEIDDLVADLPFDFKWQPAFCIHDNHLVVGLTRINLQNALKRLKDPKQKSFGDEASFARGFPGHASDQPFMWIYADVAKGIEKAWSLASGWMGSVTPEILAETGINIEELPVDDIVALLRPFTLCGIAEENGIAIRSRFPGIGSALAISGYFVRHFEGNPFAPLLMVAATTHAESINAISPEPLRGEGDTPPPPKAPPRTSETLR